MIALTLFFALLCFIFRALARATYDPRLDLFEGGDQSDWHYAYSWLTVLSFLAAAVTLILWAYWNLP